MPTDRRVFLRKGAAGIAALAIARRAPAQAAGPVVWPSDAVLGDPSAQTHELAHLLNQGQAVEVRTGLHQLADTVVCRGAGPRLSGAPGARLLAGNPDKGGLRFVECAGASVSNLRLEWPPGDSSLRTHQGAGLLFARCTDPKVSHVEVHGSPGAGILFDECNGPLVEYVVVADTRADGIHFANCNVSAATDIRCERTGDDGLAFVDYEHKPQGSGFRAERIAIVDSKSRGIAVVGASDGTVDGFSIDGTASNGLHIEQDGYYRTRVPRNIGISNGTVARVGLVAPKVGNQFGINVLRAEGVFIRDLSVHDVGRVGCSVVDSFGVILVRVQVDHTGGVGAYLQGSSVHFMQVSVSNAQRETLIARRCVQVSSTGVDLDLRGGSWSGELVVFQENQQLDLKGLGFQTDGPLPGGQALFLKGRQAGSLEVSGIGEAAVFNQSALPITFSGT